MLKLSNNADNRDTKLHREMNLITIDTFIDVPLLISAGIGLIILIFTLIVRLRKMAKISLFNYIFSVILIVGSIYSYFSKHYYPYVISIIAIAIITFVYLLIYTFDNPEKRAIKKAQKKKEEAALSKDANMISKEIVEKLNAEHTAVLNTNKALITKLSTFFNNENSLENYLD